MTPLSHAQEVINTVRGKTDRVILFYSCGKDSITLLDLVAPHFKEIVCVYMYFVKDLEHINRYIRQAQMKYTNIKFIQVPHWNLTYILRTGMYCQEKANTKLMKLRDVIDNIRLMTGIEWAFLGMKQSDNLNRRIMLRTVEYENEAINNKTHIAYPLSHWSNKDALAYCKQRRLPTPIAYSKNKKSQGLTFDVDVFLYLRENFPQDLAKIYETFPQSKVILYNYDNRTK